MPSAARSRPRRCAGPAGPAKARWSDPSSWRACGLKPADGTAVRRQTLPRDVDHLLGRHGGHGWTDGLEEARPRDGLEKPELMGNVRDAVGLEHQPRTQLSFGERDLLVGEPLFHNRGNALERGRL